jgi:hypothetical protein
MTSFSHDNCDGYTDAELTTVNAEWDRIVETDELTAGTDDYYARQQQFIDAANHFSPRNVKHISPPAPWDGETATTLPCGDPILTRHCIVDFREDGPRWIMIVSQGGDRGKALRTLDTCWVYADGRAEHRHPYDGYDGYMSAQADFIQRCGFQRRTLDHVEQTRPE